MQKIPADAHGSLRRALGADVKKLNVMLVAGARPNFMKVAPVWRALQSSRRLKPVMIHTGQHYDFLMSDVFFRELGLPKPKVCLKVGSGTHAAQTSKILSGLEKIFLKDKPALVCVFGDVNSTVAAALAAAKLRIPVAHIEAGLRSGDRSMPEEINRVLTDRLADLLFVTEPSGVRNLKKEGMPTSKIFHVGNVMIDTLFYHLPHIRRSSILRKLCLKPKAYGVLTLHRPGNVDSRTSLRRILHILKAVTSRVPLMYPIHPRSRKKIAAAGLWRDFKNLPDLRVIDPLGYTDFMKLTAEAAFVLTDSGGVQEESTALGVPCLTMRENTERPVTIKEGMNCLVGTDLKKIIAATDRALSKKRVKIRSPRFWDGKAAERILKILEMKL